MSPRLRYNLSDIPDIIEFTPGRYLAKLKSCTKTVSANSGQPMLVWVWVLLSGPNKGQQIKSWTSLQENALFGLKQHLLAFGLKGKVDQSTDKLIGKTVVLVIGKRKGETKDGREADFSAVLAVLPKSAGTKNSKAAAVVDDDDDDEDEDEDTEDEEEETEDEDEDEDEEEERPKKSKKKKVVKAKKKSSKRRRDDDDDEDEDEDDDVPF